MADRRYKMTVKSVEEALRGSCGVLVYAAEALGVSRQGLALFIKKHPDLETIREECGQVLIDKAEQHLINTIEAGKDMKSIRWFLERKGRERGYATRIENTGADGEPLQFQAIERRIVDPEKEK